MGIKEFIKTLDPNKVYYIKFGDKDNTDWAMIINNKLVFNDGSFRNIDEHSYVEDTATIYSPEQNNYGLGYKKEGIPSNQIYPDPNPMPELENGMFIKIDWYGNCLGIVLNNSIIYNNGKYSELKYVLPYIVAVYGKAVRCFNQCVDYNIIWRKNND